MFLPLDTFGGNLQIDSGHPKRKLSQHFLFEGHVEFGSVLRKHFCHCVEDNLTANRREEFQNRVALVVVDRIVPFRPDELGKHLSVFQSEAMVELKFESAVEFRRATNAEETNPEADVVKLGRSLRQQVEFDEIGHGVPGLHRLAVEDR